jgi:very-short-patch-repair endonuclease
MLTEDGFDVMRFPAREVVKFLRKNWDKYGKLIVTASGRI